MLRTLVALVTVALAPGCVVLDNSCTPLDDIEIYDRDDAETIDVQRPIIREAITLFGEQTGRDCVPVDEIRIVRDIPPNLGFPPPSDPIGRFIPLLRRIEIERLAPTGIDHVAVHELCHALDHLEHITDDHLDTWLPTSEEEAPAGYPEAQWAGESFAQFCARGPTDPTDRVLFDAYELALDPRVQFVDDVVFPDAPGPEAPVLLDLELDVDVQTWAMPEGSVVEAQAATTTGIAVLLRNEADDRPAGPLTLHLFELDPLREVSTISIDPFDGDEEWFPSTLYAGDSAMFVADPYSERPFVRVDADGTVSPTGMPAAGGDFELSHVGVTLDGVAITAELTTRQVVVVDFDTGTLTPAGLPGPGGDSAWLEDGQAAFLEHAGVWRGTPATGWRITAHAAPSRPVRLADGRGLGRRRLRSQTAQYVAVATGPDGVDHFPATLTDVAGRPYVLGGRWRLVDFRDGALQVTTVDP